MEPKTKEQYQEEFNQFIDQKFTSEAAGAIKASADALPIFEPFHTGMGAYSFTEFMGNNPTEGLQFPELTLPLMLLESHKATTGSDRFVESLRNCLNAINAILSDMREGDAKNAMTRRYFGYVRTLLRESHSYGKLPIKQLDAYLPRAPATPAQEMELDGSEE